MAVQGPIVITGASSGIGAACAQYLDALGFTVWAGVRSTQDGEALTRLTSSRLRGTKKTSTPYTPYWNTGFRGLGEVLGRMSKL